MESKEQRRGFHQPGESAIQKMSNFDDMSVILHDLCVSLLLRVCVFFLGPAILS